MIEITRVLCKNSTFFLYFCAVLLVKIPFYFAAHYDNLSSMTNDKKGGADFPPKAGQIAQQNSYADSAQNNKSQNAEREERVLRFWHNNEIFKKTLEKPANKGEFVFYDGPPFATGKPHYGHLLPGTAKDVIPRYKTMKGYRVQRNWGWDCHGLPIENLIQKENNLNTKQDIEAFGIKKFNQAAKASVFRYDADWKKIVPRTGRFVDMENQYTTMDNNFMESVWWGFGEIYKKGWAYENFRSMHISPALETSLSNFEVNLDYRDIVDISIYVKFKLKDDDFSLIAWTTTPWTLFGNVALAVGSDIDYVKVEIDTGDEVEKVIVARDLAEEVLKDKKYKIIEEISGADLVGKEYEPVFDHYSKKDDLENRQNGWKIYAANFVTTEDGTGIVHIAPAFGDDDLKLGQENNLPFVQHVNIDGSIKEDISELAGKQAKPASTEEEPNKHQETDIEVLKLLAPKGKLFAKKKYTHSYPHCWRTGVPLLNYALSSWFIKVTEFKNKMSSLNDKVNWVPESVGKKRFGNWLENAKDWGISRSRYWGTPIPIWKSEDGKEIEVLGSVADIKKRTKSTNNYFIARHGEGDHNVNKFLSANNEVVSNLTDKGREQAKNAGQKLKSEKIDMIFCSPLIRTKDTAKIIANEIGFNEKEIIVDDRLIEVQTGVLNGQSNEKFHGLFKNILDRFEIAPEEGENVSDVRRRIGDFIYDINKKYSGKNILIVTHEYPVWAFMGVKDGLNNQQMAELRDNKEYIVPTGYFAKYNFSELPHDDDYILDLHRPYIDEIKFTKNGKEMTRIEDIFDGWVDSGSMPFAVPHYPFEKDSNLAMSPGGMLKTSRRFPADFIAESLDQTRGWFYTLLALNTALFGKSPYKNVIVSGLVLAEDGQKMSKSLRNYPDINIVIDKYGADALRYYLISSPVIRGESMNFSEKGVDEVLKKIIQRYLNVVSFYELYKDSIFDKPEKIDEFVKPVSENVLDKWILARLDQTLQEVTKNLDKYQLDSACRPFFDFVDDLSTWYLRRSRDRVKGDDEKDKAQTLQTLGYVIFEFSKMIAPFMPFVAENVYQRMTGYDYKNSDKSVHLLSWTNYQKVDEQILSEMRKVRQIVANSLEARDSAGIKVRQPLSKVEIGIELGNQMQNIIADEINVKGVIHSSDLKEKEVRLDTEITNDLRQEGNMRELVRFIQSYRKEIKLNPSDKIRLSIKTDKPELVKKFADYIQKITNASALEFSNEADDGKDINIDNVKFIVKIRK